MWRLKKKEKKAQVFLKSPYSTQPTKQVVFQLRGAATGRQGSPRAPALRRSLLLLGRVPGRSALQK